MVLYKYSSPTGLTDRRVQTLIGQHLPPTSPGRQYDWQVSYDLTLRVIF